MNRTVSKRRAARRAATLRKDAQWAKAVKDRAGWMCEVCGAGRMLDAHHIIGKKAVPALRYDLENGACLSRDCHEWAHRNPFLFRAWLMTWRPDRMARLEARLPF